ncbi:hypothetical protein ANCDUO_06699 [Ancylostoma duodenale]|uniref:DOMON domain-containing protein n=1 Tax=Ancylostoma duodenale TaxID=51022 RepID=A0A0C2GVD4_9BILA|nr:hypothetical protein ANCDUO_06699 [Ancylostoma duodenale]
MSQCFRLPHCLFTEYHCSELRLVHLSLQAHGSDQDGTNQSLLSPHANKRRTLHRNVENGEGVEKGKETKLFAPLSIFKNWFSKISCISALSFEGCNTTQSCWFHPPNCEENERAKCISGVRWSMEPDGLKIQLQTHVNDLDPTRPFYAALGFSYNQRMAVCLLKDDDTVVECVQPLKGPGKVQVSFNDETFNNVLPQASSVLLEGGSTVLEDGLLTCNMKFMLDKVPLVSNESQFMIHDLESQPYYLLFARGNADPWTLEKDIHSVNDNPQFPWMSQEMEALREDLQVSFCRENCTSNGIYMLDDGMQSRVERYWRYRVAVLHGEDPSSTDYLKNYNLNVL